MASSIDSTVNANWENTRTINIHISNRILNIFVDESQNSHDMDGLLFYRHSKADLQFHSINAMNISVISMRHQYVEKSYTNALGLPSNL